MTNDFNFREECIDKYDEEMYDLVMESFDQLPIAAHVNGQYLAVHGGISSFVTSLSAINEVDRKREPPDEDSLFSDLLWADPAEDDDIYTDYSHNWARDFSVMFGKDPANEFLEKEGLKAIVRAHE